MATGSERACDRHADRRRRRARAVTETRPAFCESKTMSQTSSAAVSAMRGLLSAALAFAVVSDATVSDKSASGTGQMEYYDVHNAWGQRITTILSSRATVESRQDDYECSASRMYHFSEQLSRFAQARYQRRTRSSLARARQADGVPTVDMCEDKGWKSNKHTGKEQKFARLLIMPRTAISKCTAFSLNVCTNGICSPPVCVRASMCVESTNRVHRRRAVRFFY